MWRQGTWNSFYSASVVINIKVCYGWYITSLHLDSIKYRFFCLNLQPPSSSMKLPIGQPRMGIAKSSPQFIIRFIKYKRITCMSQAYLNRDVEAVVLSSSRWTLMPGCQTCRSYCVGVRLITWPTSRWLLKGNSLRNPRLEINSY